MKTDQFLHQVLSLLQQDQEFEITINRDSSEESQELENKHLHD